MYKVSTNDEHERQIEFTASGILVEGKLISWDQATIGKNRFHILMNDRSYTCEVIEADARNKSFEIKVNGIVHHVKVKDRFDELLKQLGMDKLATHKVNSIKAPMPGLVLKIMINEQEEIHEGDSVLILEAMKMENVIKSPGSGVVKSIKVKERDAVEKNQILVELV
ncbi:MAG: acetyl-CoA carboxylase biotin carboxyl carrier protein subunit [Chitinophagales bacterium]